MATISELIPLFLGLGLAGALAGFSAGLFGVGGGAIMVPVLATAFSVQGFDQTFMHSAVATSLAVIILTSGRSLMAHSAKGVVDWTVLRSWGLWVVLGAILGMIGVRYASTEALRIMFACFAIFASAQFFFGRPSWRLREELPTGMGAVGLAGGIGGLSALLGIGGGTFGVTAMTLCGRGIHQSVGTASGLGVLIGLPSAIAAMFLGFSVDGRPAMSLGYVSVPAALGLALGALFMAPIGAALAHRLNPVHLRRAFALMLAVVAVKMLT